jgi:cytochrome c
MAGHSHTLAGILLMLASFSPAVSGTPAKRADIQAGEAVYARCLACHALAYDRTGPRHCGLFGRRAGSVKGFPYSDAMKRSRIVWDEKTLNAFLANPTKNIPGTAMGYAGVQDDVERANLIAYLRQANESDACKR